jgi:hypothetical protein
MSYKSALVGAAMLGATAICSSAHADLNTFTGNVTLTDPTQVNRVFRDGTPSVAGTAKPFPGTIPGTFNYNEYDFTNPLSTSIIV